MVNRLYPEGQSRFFYDQEIPVATPGCAQTVREGINERVCLKKSSVARNQDRGSG